MSKWLIVYGTTDGHTRTVAERMGKILQEIGDAATVHDVAALPAELNLHDYNAVWIGGSAHQEKHQAGLARFVSKHVDTLNAMPSAFFSVSLSAAGTRPEQREDAERMAQGFLEATGWKPRRVELVAGALLYTRYNFIMRFLMKRIAAKAGGDTDTSRDYDYTDWEAVESYTRQFATQVTTTLH